MARHLPTAICATMLPLLVLVATVFQQQLNLAVTPCGAVRLSLGLRTRMNGFAKMGDDDWLRDLGIDADTIANAVYDPLPASYAGAGEVRSRSRFDFTSETARDDSEGSDVILDTSFFRCHKISKAKRLLFKFLLS